ncbi:MAG: hypothetical protein PHD12_01525 [Methylotenera sp.]|nr:hypothetical protein [Methylotenera sp.]
MNQASDLSEEAIVAIESGNLIHAIKITREKTGLGLKGSADRVKAYVNAHPALKEKLQLNRTTVVISRETAVIVMIAIALVAVYINFFAV